MRRRAAERTVSAEYSGMRNLRMAEKLTAGEALDVRVVGTDASARGPAFVGVFELAEYVDDIDYCDAQEERWIWSIGRERATGEVYAALDARFYQNPAFDCLWLR